MSTEHTIYLNIFFVMSGLFFYFLEKYFPERKLNFKLEFKYEVGAFIMLNISGLMVSSPLQKFYTQIPFNFPLRTEVLILNVILATLVLDFINYWVHYFMHTNKYIWRTHVFHHKIQNLYWFSGLRASFMHYFQFIFTRVTVGFFLFNLNSLELLIYFCIGVFTNFYQHTNSNTGHRIIEWIFVSPRIHRLHHSTKGQRCINIGTIFSFWDRLFGTFVDPAPLNENYDLGIEKTKNRISMREFIGI